MLFSVLFRLLLKKFECVGCVGVGWVCGGICGICVGVVCCGVYVGVGVGLLVWLFQLLVEFMNDVLWLVCVVCNWFCSVVICVCVEVSVWLSSMVCCMSRQVVFGWWVMVLRMWVLVCGFLVVVWVCVSWVRKFFSVCCFCGDMVWGFVWVGVM